MVMLSQLLNINVLSDRFFGKQLVSPNRLQRGYEEGMGKLESVIEYNPLNIYTTYSLANQSDYGLIDKYLNSGSFPTIPNINLGKRKQLNEMIIAQDKVSEIVSGLSTGMPIYFDLCAGLANPECKQALLNTPFPPEYLWEKAWALTIMHLIRPDAELADFVLENISTLTKSPSEINSLPSQEHYVYATNRLIFA